MISQVSVELLPHASVAVQVHSFRSIQSPSVTCSFLVTVTSEEWSFTSGSNSGSGSFQPRMSTLSSDANTGAFLSGNTVIRLRTEEIFPQRSIAFQVL